MQKLWPQLCPPQSPCNRCVATLPHRISYMTYSYLQLHGYNIKQKLHIKNTVKYISTGMEFKVAIACMT